jgi:hypothetical protein
MFVSTITADVEGVGGGLEIKTGAGVVEYVDSLRFTRAEIDGNVDGLSSQIKSAAVNGRGVELSVSPTPPLTSLMLLALKLLGGGLI